MKYLAFACLFFSFEVLAGPKLYVFDCGLISMNNLDMFNIKAEESSVREFFVPCYLVEHDKGRLLFDGGLPKNIADSETPVEMEPFTLVYDRWIVDQLADIGLAPKDIDYAAYSHLHFDHAGAANAFVESETLMQRNEWEAAFGEGIPHADTSQFDKLKEDNVNLIDGDHDVFGDGTVQLISTPGHTPGHQVLLVKLDNTGPILLSGDLFHTRANRALKRVPHFNDNAEMTVESMARVEKLLAETDTTLWIEHDKVLADSLKKAPAYYD